MKNNRLDATKRRRRDMTAHYKPNSARHREEPVATEMGTCIPEEPQSPNARDLALLAKAKIRRSQVNFNYTTGTAGNGSVE
jgi:hypothetical protein